MMMKQTILSMLISVISINAFSQIEEAKIEKAVFVGEVRGLYDFVANMTYKTDDDSRIYTIRYRDVQYTSIVEIKSISFRANEDEIEQLYQIMNSMMDGEKGAVKKLKIGNGTMTLTPTSSMGVKFLVLYVQEEKEPSGSLLLTRKQIDKLFGKSIAKK